MRTAVQEPTKQEVEDMLKKLLHQNGMCLLIYPEGSNTSLLTALAEAIHTTEETLHQKITKRLEHDIKHYSLPRRLTKLYDDNTLVEDFKKYPELYKFTKIIFELFSVSVERRLNIFSVVPNGQGQYNLSCKIINQNGYGDSISIGNIDKKYYNIKERNLDSRNQLSFEEVFKNPHNIDSDELIQTFKSEKLLADKEDKKAQKNKPDDCKSSGRIEEEIYDLEINLKRAKSSMPYKEVESIVQQFQNADIDGVSLGDKLELREDARLINECNNGLQNNFQQQSQYHNNTHLMPNVNVMSHQQQMYFLYIQNYMNYPPHMHVQPTPQQIPSPTLTAQPMPNYFGNQPINMPLQPSSPTESSENKRYTGRLKFFDDAKNYGFIIMDADDSDIFVHYDDLQKAGISKQVIKSFKNEMYMHIRFSFKVMEYFGKYKKSRKAVELIIIDDGLSLLTAGYPLPQ